MYKNNVSGGAKFIGIGILAFISLTFIYTYFKSVIADPGQEVVLVDRPYFFGHEGIRDQPLREGRMLVPSTTKAIPIIVIPQSIKAPFDDLSSGDNILLDFESTIQYRVTDSRLMVKSFGENWFENNIKNQYSAIVREAVKSKTMTEMMSDVAAANEVDAQITKELRALVKESKLPVEVINITLGRAKPNPDVLLQMNKTASEQQRFKTLDAAERAEVKRKAEQIARADADNAYRNKMDLDTSQFIALEQAKLYADACKSSSNCIVTSGQNPLVLNPSKGTK